ncbi:MAG: septum formation initiator family protein [Nitrospinae bacterium]|nr:septum formation initiator family protein [Nitrospinota bacterium]
MSSDKEKASTEDKKGKNNKKDNKKRIFILLIGSIVFFIFLVLITIFSEDGIIYIYNLNKNLVIIKEDIDRLIDENQRLKREIEALKTDLSYIEKIAREDLGLVKHGETVFEFVQKE